MLKLSQKGSSFINILLNNIIFHELTNTLYSTLMDESEEFQNQYVWAAGLGKLNDAS
jgi:hypothetical protein